MALQRSCALVDVRRLLRTARRTTNWRAGWQRAIPIASAEVIFLSTSKLYANRPPTAIGRRQRVITQRIEVIQVVADRSERLLLLAPVFFEIHLASSSRL